MRSSVYPESRLVALGVRNVMISRIALALFLLACTLTSPAQDNLAVGPLTVPAAHPKSQMNNDALIRMTRAGLDDSLILETVRTQPGQYSTSPDDLIALKQAGVSQAVISAVVARSSGLAERTPDRPVTVSPLSPEQDENGVYKKDRDGQWALISPELVTYRSGGWLKSTVTNNIVKKDRNGEVAGAESKLVLHPGDELLILAPPNADPVEYQLLRFRLHGDRREFRASTGGVFSSNDSTKRDQVDVPIKRVAPRIFSLHLPEDIGGGEYGVLPPGSASVPGIAFAGKIYTFAITIAK